MKAEVTANVATVYPSRRASGGSAPSRSAAEFSAFLKLSPSPEDGSSLSGSLRRVFRSILSQGIRLKKDRQTEPLHLG